MPGVVVTTAVRTGPTTPNTAPASTFFVAGTAERGPTTSAALVTNIAEFEERFGGYSANRTLHQNLQMFFEEGGSRAYVARVVGAGGTTGTLTLDAAITFTAANVGAWSSNLSVAVVAGTGATRRIQIFLNGALKYTSPDVANAGAAAAAINSSSVATIYLSAAATNASVVPTIASAAALSAGSDGSAPSASDHVTALTRFTSDLGAGAVALPGLFSSDAYNGLLAHAVANNRIALCGFDPASDSAAAITTASSYSTQTGAEHMAFYFPHVTATNSSGLSLTLSPEAFVAAKRSVAHNSSGPWKAAAGVDSRARWVTGLARQVDRTTGDTLDSARINALRVIQGGVRVYGARSISSDETNYRYITYRDTLNYIVAEAERTLEELVFSPVNGRDAVFARAEARLIALMEPMRLAGAFYDAFDVDGRRLDSGYSVRVDSSLNPVSQLATGTVRAQVGVRLAAVADLIRVEVLKSNLTNSVV